MPDTENGQRLGKGIRIIFDQRLTSEFQRIRKTVPRGVDGDGRELFGPDAHVRLVNLARDG
jgi:hypothetical protein